jgi:hypothetical protein
MDEESMKQSLEGFLRDLASSPPSPPDKAGVPDLEAHREFAGRLAGEIPLP